MGVHGWTAYLIVFGAIFANNLLPAFGPPTWSLLVLFKFNTDVPMAALVVGGAASSAAGRYVLARISHALRGHFSAERLARLETGREFLERNRRRSLGSFAVFLVSPLPSAQLFVAAGLLGMRLRQLTAAFFVGRLVTYTLYTGGATLAKKNFGDAVTESFTSPLGIALQLLLVAGVVALVAVDWTRWLPGASPRD